jgi:hypothetical protein
MTSKNYVLVDEHSRALWVRPVPCAYELLASALRRARELTGRSVQLVCAPVAAGDSDEPPEVLTDAIEQLAKQPDASVAIVEVLLANPPRFDITFKPPEETSTLSRSQFVIAARFTLLDAAEPDVLLNEVFEKSQNIEEPWNPFKPCRSTSVGDVLVLWRGAECVAYEVRNIGFSTVSLS